MKEILEAIKSYKKKNKFSDESLVFIQIYDDGSGGVYQSVWGEYIHLDAFDNIEDLKELCK